MINPFVVKLVKPADVKCVCSGGHEGVVDLLLSRPELDINMADMFGSTALMEASRAPASLLTRFSKHWWSSSTLMFWILFLSVPVGCCCREKIWI